jgi:membrane associated rhomboid family serine protease
MFVPYNVDVPMERVPVVNWVIIGVTCLVSIVLFIREARLEQTASRRQDETIRRALERGRNDEDIDKLLRDLERQEEEAIPPLALRWDRLLPVWLFTHLFVHADLLHLIGNMVFLFCFGNAVNAKLGHWQFLLIYLLLGALAGLAFLPFLGGRCLIGASGAIMGIVGVFVVLFPRNDVEVFYWFGWIWAGATSIAAYWVVLFFVLCDLIGVALDRGGAVAYVAHLGGALGGFALGIALVKLRVIRSTRYEENLLECLGFQRKRDPRRRKAKKTMTPPAKTQTLAQLLKNGRDCDICERAFRRVLRRHDGEVSAIGLEPDEQVVMLVWHSLRVIDDGGFGALFEKVIPGDRRLVRTAEAYQAIGLPRAGIAIRKAAALLAGPDAREYLDERVGRSLHKLTGLPAAEERKFMEVIDEVELRLAEYVRAHREFFLALDREA